MNNADYFLEEEVRCQYTVSRETKELWAVQLDLLTKLKEICDKYNIKFFLIWGTLLGAIRHGGYIPWDDDLDVGMRREDYNKLCEVAEKECNAPYFFQTARNDRKYFIGYARLRNSNTTGIIKENMSPDYNNGVYIDIYPLDGYPQNNMKLKYQLFKRNYYMALAIAYYKDFWPKSIIRKGFIKVIRCFSHLYKYDRILDKYDYWCTRNNKNPEYIGLFYHYTLWKKYKFKTEYVEKIIQHKYEYLEMPIPADYDRLLREVYGDYMKFPPVEERGQWHNDQIIYDCSMSYKDYFAKKINEC